MPINFRLTDERTNEKQPEDEVLQMNSYIKNGRKNMTKYRKLNVKHSGEEMGKMHKTQMVVEIYESKNLDE